MNPVPLSLLKPTPRRGYRRSEVWRSPDCDLHRTLALAKMPLTTMELATRVVNGNYRLTIGALNRMERQRVVRSRRVRPSGTCLRLLLWSAA